VELVEMKAYLRAGRRTAKLDVLAKTFEVAQTDLGALPVSCDGAEPYLTGHKLKLKIGNPLNGDISGYTLVCTYGLKEPTDKPSTNNTAFVNSVRVVTTDFTDPPLKAGAWTPVELALVPSKPEELESLELEIRTSSISLRSVPRR
jgi:hypothetical protein